MPQAVLRKHLSIRPMLTIKRRTIADDSNIWKDNRKIDSLYIKAAGSGIIFWTLVLLLSGETFEKDQY